MPKTIDDDAKKPADATPPPATPPADEDISKKDTSKFTAEQKDDYIANLKDENARRRIETRETKAALEKQQTALEKLQADHKAAADKIAAHESEKKKASEAEKSEVERLNTRISEMEAAIKETTGKLNEKDAALMSKDVRIKQIEREALIDRLVISLGYTFASEYERDGFIAKMSQVKDGDFALSDERAIYEVNQFVTKNKKAPNTPPPGPGGRTSELPLVEEVKALTALSMKRGLNPAEKKRLDELIAMTGQQTQ